MELELNNIYNMDCLEGMRQLKDNSIDVIITDPPYAVSFSKGFDDSKAHVKPLIPLWLKEMYRVLKPGCHCYIYIPTKEAALWLNQIDQVFEINNILSTRTYTTQNYTKNNFQFNSQLIAFCSKGIGKELNKVDFIKTSPSWFKDKRNKKPKEYTYSYPAFITECFSNTKGNGKVDRHPCEKNDELIEFFIKLSTHEGETVLEPFIGGGSTIVAAINSKRKYIGFELSEDYFKTAEKRIEELKKSQEEMKGA